MALHFGYSIISKTCEWTCILYILIPRVGCFHIIYSVLASSLIFSLEYAAAYLLSHIIYPAFSIQHFLSHISRFAFTFTFFGLHLNSSVCIWILRFAFAFFRFSFRISHQTIQIQWVLHFILLFRICNLHTENYNTNIDMSHINTEQFASTAMQNARSRLLELPNEASIWLSFTT